MTRIRTRKALDVPLAVRQAFRNRWPDIGWALLDASPIKAKRPRHADYYYHRILVACRETFIEQVKESIVFAL